MTAEGFLCLNIKTNTTTTMAKKGVKVIRFDTQAVVYAIFCDLVNGLTQTDIKTKLLNNDYGEKTEQISHTTVRNLINAAYDMARDERESQIEHQRDLFWNRLTYVYSNSIAAGDRQSALKSLDMFAKYGALYEVPTSPSVAVTGDPLSGKITIDFGLTTPKKDEE